MLQVKKDYMLHIGVRPGDILFQYTTVCTILHYILSKENIMD